MSALVTRAAPSNEMPQAYYNWRITYQSSEHAARVAWLEAQRLAAEAAECRAWERSVNEALNSGDGSYRP